MYDMIIIGAGPAGLSAALYASRAMLKTLIIEKGIVGGLITTTTEVDNYPGSEAGATGTTITTRMYEQCTSAGAVLEYDEISQIDITSNGFALKGLSGTAYEAKVVAYAAGSYPRMLGVKGEEEFRGRGVSYCATCDAGFFKGKHVAVVGGGDSALKEAEYLTKFASKVTILHRRDEFRANKALVERILSNDSISVLYDSIVDEIYGEMSVTGIRIHDLKTNELYPYEIDGIFIFAGYQANVDLIKDFVELDQNGSVITDENMKTSQPGLYAIGDVRRKPLRQVITAAADGAICGVEAEKYLSEQV
jgi:thioredoxin reductase (NADPH)